MAVIDRFITPPHILYEGVVERYMKELSLLSDAFDKLNTAKDRFDRFFNEHTAPFPDNAALNAEYNQLRAVYTALSAKYASTSINIRVAENALRESVNAMRDAIDEMRRSSEARPASDKPAPPDKSRITYL